MTKSEIFDAIDEEMLRTQMRLEGLREAREKLKKIDPEMFTDALFLVKWMQDRG